MIRNLKALGVALAAVFAMSALTASAASATDFFTSGTQSALMTGVSHGSKFELKAGVKFECTTAKYAGTAVNGSSEVTVDASYNGTKNEASPHSEANCTGEPTNLSAVHMNGCHYVLTGNTTGSDNGVDATIWITCPGTAKITLTTGLGATLKVPAQTPTSGGVIYKNETGHTGGAAVTIKATATGITTTCESAFICGLGGIPTHSNTSIYTDHVVATGYADNEGLSNGTPVTEGPRTPISVS